MHNRKTVVFNSFKLIWKTHGNFKSRYHIFISQAFRDLSTFYLPESPHCPFVVRNGHRLTYNLITSAYRLTNTGVCARSLSFDRDVSPLSRLFNSISSVTEINWDVK